jgi:hypothetical protein
MSKILHLNTDNLQGMGPEGSRAVLDYIRHLRRGLAAHRMSLLEPKDFRDVPRPKFDAADYALHEWKLGVLEETHPEYIYDIYCTGEKGCTSAWKWLPWDGPGKEWAEGWCGAFVAYCHGMCNLDRVIRRNLLPSPSRLLDQRRAMKVGIDTERYLGWFSHNSREVLANDALCIDTFGSEAPDHLALCVAGPGESIAARVAEVLGLDTTVPTDADWCVTCEGNARGWLVSGTKGSGVIVRTRSVSEIRGSARFGEGDYAP